MLMIGLIGPGKKLLHSNVSIGSFQPIIRVFNWLGWLLFEWGGYQLDMKVSWLIGNEEVVTMIWMNYWYVWYWLCQLLGCDWSVLGPLCALKTRECSWLTDFFVIDPNLWNILLMFLLFCVRRCRVQPHVASLLHFDSCLTAKLSPIWRPNWNWSR